MLSKIRGIVLQKTKYSENSIIVKIYTDLFGLQSYILRISKKNNAKTNANSLQHLSLVDIVTYHKSSRKIHHIKEFKINYISASIPFDIRKSSIALFINEVVLKSIREEESNIELFDFIFNSVQMLDKKTDNFNCFHLKFMLELSRYMGFSPLNNYSEEQQIFNLSDGKFQKHIPEEHPYYIKGNISYQLNLLMNSSPENDSPLKINNQKELLRTLIKYFEIHITGFKEPKSHKILEEIFS